MTKIEIFLKNLIQDKNEYLLTIEDKKIIKIEGVKNYIFRKLNSSKFRASSMPDELKTKVMDKITFCVENKLPIHITVPFGGFKKWQLPSYPEVDWAEVFNIILLRQYLSPIAAGYEHGVLLNYFSDEIFISKMNNIPQTDLDIYNNQFRDLLDYFSEFLPSNFKVKFSKIRDYISQEEIFNRFDKTVVELKGKWNSLPQETRELRLNKSERNYKADLSKLTEKEKYNLLFESTLIHDAFIFGDWDSDTPWAFDKDMIAVGFRYTNAWGIHLKSSRSSTVQFWVGTGVLIKREEVFIPSILTYEQYLKTENNLKTFNVNLFPEKFKNLNTIKIL